MPPRFAYWTILAGGLPTSFRAANREDLLPTLRRIQERHADAELKWFARGKLWDSPEAARLERHAPAQRKDRSWRPGGEHRDPREKHRLAKHQRNIAKRQRRFSSKHADAARSRAAASPAGPEPGHRRRDLDATSADRRDSVTNRASVRSPRQGSSSGAREGGADRRDGRRNPGGAARKGKRR